MVATAHEIIALLENYNLDIVSVKSTESVYIDTLTNSVIVNYSYESGNMIQFTGTVPPQLATGTTYYAILVDSTHIRVALTYDDAIAGVYLSLPETGSGLQLKKIDYKYVSTQWLETRRDGFVIPYVEGVIRSPIGRTEQVVEQYSGQGKDVLVLDRRPVISLDKIQYLLSSNFNWILTPDSIYLAKEQGMLKARRSVEMTANTTPLFSKGTRNIEVTYTVGYLNVPADLKEAVIYLCAEQALGMIASRTGGGNPGSEGTKQFGNRGMYTELRNDLSRQAHFILSKYSTGVVGA